MIQIFSDPCCNLSGSELKNLQVKLFPYITTYQGKDYIIKTDYDFMTPKTLLKALTESNEPPVFSRPPLGEWKEMLETSLKDGNDILYISMSQKLTGSGVSLSILGNLFAESYPDRKVIVFDSKSVSWGEGYLVEQACKLRDQGKALDEIIQELAEIRKSLENWYLPVNLKTWAGANRGATALLKSDSDFTLLTCDLDGNFRPDKSFESRQKGIDYLKLSEAEEVWVSFTLDVPKEDIDYILKRLPVKSRVSYCSPPFTTITVGANDIEIALIRKDHTL